MQWCREEEKNRNEETKYCAGKKTDTIMRKISLINQLELQKRKREREKKETTYEQLNLPHFSGLVMFSSTEGIEGTMIQKGNKAAAAGASNRSISRCENSTRAKDNIYQNGPEDLPPGGFLIRIEFLVRPLASSSTSATPALHKILINFDQSSIPCYLSNRQRAISR